MPQSLTTLCGSLHYVAPELLRHHPYDESADMWSVGVIIFFLLSGYLVSSIGLYDLCRRSHHTNYILLPCNLFSCNIFPWQPFHHKDQCELFKIIRLGKFSFSKRFWAGISEDATSLITHLLDVDPATRYSATQALQSKWIKRAKESGLEKNNLGDSLVRIANISTSLKGVVRAIQWTNRDSISSSLTIDDIDSDVVLVDASWTYSWLAQQKSEDIKTYVSSRDS